MPPEQQPYDERYATACALLDPYPDPIWADIFAEEETPFRLDGDRAYYDVGPGGCTRDRVVQLLERIRRTNDRRAGDASKSADGPDQAVP